MKILMVYIATSKHYFRFFEGFYKSLDNFCPGIEKVIHIFTDQLQNPFLSEVVKNGNVQVSVIEHKPWPLTALMKYHYVKQAIEDNSDCDVVFYADSKVEFRKKNFYNSDKTLLDITNIQYKGKLTTVDHNLAPNYPSDYEKLQFWVNDRNTNARIDGRYQYHQSGFFGGEKDIVLKMCNQCIWWTENDLANHRMPSVDDESYLNRWIFENPQLVITLPGSYWGCDSDSECERKDSIIHLRDHSDIEFYKYQVKEGLR